MKINRTVRIGPGCKIDTDEGRFANWPGRVIGTGEPWWSFTPAGGGRPVLVTVRETIAQLERARSQAIHPSSLTPRHLRAVPDLDWCDPHGLERPA